MEKKFIIRCQVCRWAELTTGISDDLTHLTEVRTCNHCSGRKFKCPKCGRSAKMIKVDWKL